MKGRRLLLLCAPVLAFLLYLPSLRCDFVFDDRGVILTNPLMQDLSSAPRLLASPYWVGPRHAAMLYRPLTSLSFAWDRALSGGRPPWFHAVNVALHALAVALVALMALDLFRGRPAPAAAAALLFAAHPVHVEAVTGIVGRSEILAALGVIGTVLCHARALRHPGWRWSTAAWAACLAGMLAKESAIVAPVAAFAWETASDAYAPSPARRRLYGGYAVCILVTLAARAAVLGGLGPGAAIPFIDNPAASSGPVYGRLTGAASIVRYLGLLFWPRHLSADYSYDQIPVVRSLADPLALGGIAVMILILAAAWTTRRRAPSLSFGLLLAAVGASLTTNVLLFIGTPLAERLMYLPSAGVCLAAASGFAAAAGRGPKAARAAWLACGIIVAALAARTWVRIGDWRDDGTLYASAARVSPRSARIRYNLGNVHLRAQHYPEAEASYRAALQIYPPFLDARVNLGMALVQQGRAREALSLLEAAARDDPRNPDLEVNLGAAYRALGDDARAGQAFDLALRLDPGSSRAHNNLGSLALRRGDLGAAIASLETAVRLDPDVAVYRTNLADALTAAGRPAEAAAQFEAAARLDPVASESHRGLGEAALARGDRAAAESEFRIAVTGPAPSARAANFLGYLLALRQDYGGAAEAYERAVALDPGLADAHRSLGLIYARRPEDRARAVMHLKTSLRLDPAQPQADDVRSLLARLERTETERGGKD